MKTVQLDAIDMGVVALLLDRLPRQIDNVEEDGHVNAGRYMRTAIRLLAKIQGSDVADHDELTPKDHAREIRRSEIQG